MTTQPTDRQLLEWAARAAGLTWSEKIAKERESLGLIALWITTEDQVHTAWNPLEDDGPALRLAVKLRISITMSEFGRVVCRAREWTRSIEPYGNDAGAATRRAIVLAAAHIDRDSQVEGER